MLNEPAAKEPNPTARPNRQRRLFTGIFIAANGFVELDENKKIA